jgi:hypothetical protein
MREVSKAVEMAINAASPRNLYGDPVFRAVWSQDVLHYAAGWWNDYDRATGAIVRRVFEARKVPKYQCAARWIIERWMPPEFFGTPELWEQATVEYSAQHNMAVLELGPYPSRGDYVLLWKCEDADGNFLELTPTLAQYTVEIALMPIPSVGEMQAQAMALREREDRLFSKAVDDLIGDPFPFLGRVSNVTPLSLKKKIRQQKKRGLEL